MNIDKKELRRLRHCDYFRRMRLQYIAKGICTRCHNKPARPGVTLCATCAKHVYVLTHAYRNLPGHCKYCGAKLAEIEIMQGRTRHVRCGEWLQAFKKRKKHEHQNSQADR